RPIGQLNGHWNPYCAFNRNRTPRTLAHAAIAFRKAFARIYLIVHGGPAAIVDAKLRALGLPPVAHDLPVTQVEVVWNPQGYGAPDLPANSAESYYPGDRY